ncbi:MAG: ADP-ribosylglycohydrolase family protein [Thermovirgaceae bacterium]|nr:ADP-ribosylglycohydrolase family protein [Thermovirgaceae bacterium]
MLGAICGDIIGSVYEFDPIKSKIFPLFTESSTFTDDTVLTAAVARAIMNGGDYVSHIVDLGSQYPDAGYGGMFASWLAGGGGKPCNSFGNGSAMRVSPVGWAFDSLKTTLEEAEKSAAVTHDHPEGIKGAQAVAGAVYLARSGASKPEIMNWVIDNFDYDLDRLIEDIRPGYSFDETCQGSVPEAIVAFLDGEDLEDCIRNAVSLGGDADTLACIAGSIAEAYWGGVPSHIAKEAIKHLDPQIAKIVERFRIRYGLPM